MPNSENIMPPPTQQMREIIKENITRGENVFCLNFTPDESLEKNGVVRLVWS